MVKRSIFGLIYLGGSWWYLHERKEGDWITHENKSGRKKSFIKEAIEGLLQHLKEYDMFVTCRAAEELGEFLKKTKDRGGAPRLTKDEANELGGIMSALDKTFQAEAKGIHSFFTTDKRISVDKLTTKHEALFPQGVFNELPEIAKHDVKEAGMCIAFERSTAAAFHILRATEEVLRKFYCRVVKQKRVKTLNWGNITADWVKKRKRPSTTTFGNLDYIRENFRNPTIHPEARYDIEGAQSLFNLCTDVISKMISDPLWKKG
ncbi:hypothetical protein E3J62_00400 [candidate division TA06 bacterium]|uniref:Uncharacterized protein n=1 Tax=candidate division TA06 bacterium TaxID=2250710 RepID=A0A523UZ07_UNCT6|nr:MAG: hypothetical protein E3J62_00400 [candidate division TA06 bacterium]